MIDFIPPVVADERRESLVRTAGEGFSNIHRFAERFFEFVLSSESTSRDHYGFAELKLGDPGQLVFEGFGRRILGKIQYAKKDKEWFARIVFFDVATPVVGEPVVTPVYAIFIDDEAKVCFPGNARKYQLYPQVEAMERGVIYNRLKADLLCIAEDLSV